MAEAQSKKFCREVLACRREAAEAASPEHKDAWLKLADDWRKLAVEWRKLEAVKQFDQHDELIRPVTDPKRKGRYTIRDGRDEEITIGNLRTAAKKEHTAATANQDNPRSVGERALETAGKKT